MTYHFYLTPSKSGAMSLAGTSDDSIRYLHSKYDPILEAKQIVNRWCSEQTFCDTIYVLGLGLGYHILEVLRASSAQKIEVIECFSDIVSLARTVHPQLFENDRIHIRICADETAFRQIFGLIDMTQLYMLPAFIDLVPFEDIRRLLQEILLLKTSNVAAEQLMYDNFNANAKNFDRLTFVSGQRDCFCNRPGVILAAGPSFTASLDVIRQLQSLNAVIFTVSANLRTLLQARIIPNAAILTDGQAFVKSHVTDLPNDAERVPLFALPTVHPDVLNAYPGQVELVLQDAYPLSKNYAMQHGLDTFQTGGSVATLALSLLYDFGCDPIVLIGQDLAFVDGKSHAMDTNHIVAAEEDSFRAFDVPGVLGKTVKTTLTWLAFKHWIERFIRSHSNRTYVNGSRGAAITGTVAFQNESSLLNFVSSHSTYLDL